MILRLESKQVFFCIMLLSSFLWSNCSMPLTDQQYWMYIQKKENGLMHTCQVGTVQVTCTYRPTDLLVAQELAGTLTPDTQIVDSMRRSFADRAYFALSFARNGMELENRYLPDQQAFTRAVTYLNAGIAQDAYLVTSNTQPDSVVALTAIYPRQYGSTGHSTVLLVFDTRHLDLRQGFTLSYHDTQFGLGTLRFPFSAEALANLPKLKFR